MTLKELVKKAQAALSLTPDGDWGPISEAKADKFDIEITVKEKPVEIKPMPVTVDGKDYFGAPWVGAYIHLLGKHETDPELNAALVPEWSKEGLPQFKTLAGNDHAWCSVLVNASFRRVGIKPTNSAMAMSWRTFGVRAGGWWFGAPCSMQHRSGGNHVGFFLYWIDQAKGLAAFYSGNSGNRLCVAQYNFSGHAKGHDEVRNGPRWPEGWPDGQELSKDDVLRVYPHLKVGGTAESTR